MPREEVGHNERILLYRPQVYRGALRGVGGAEVAIKVQRPAVLASVALDLYLMRALALALRRLPSVRSFLFKCEINQPLT